MNEGEAIYCLKAESERHPEVCEECHLYGQCGCDHCYEDASDIAIKALEDIQQYRAIGTVAECREAMKLYNSIRERVSELNKLRDGVRNHERNQKNM